MRAASLILLGMTLGMLTVELIAYFEDMEGRLSDVERRAFLNDHSTEPGFDPAPTDPKRKSDASPFN
jgi:hypothetical protein